jgi:RNA polymerase nonessential primary-like sigma factor
MPKQKLTQTTKTPTRAKQGSISADMVRTYLHEIGKIPLLTNEEEIIYGKQVQHLMGYINTQETLSEQFDRLPTEQEWAEAVGIEPDALNVALKQGTRAKRKMIEANLRLVVSVAKKYQKRNLELLDLVQEGTLGLERAVDKFDPTKGFKFSTYAYWWIRQAITRATAAEVAESLEIKTEQVRECLSLARQPISLDLRIGDNQDTELADLLEDQGHSPETYALNESLRDGVQSLLSELTPKQRQVMILRYGLEDGQELSLASISKRMDLSREQVRQLERQAMDALRKRRQRVQEYIIAS